ncbi:MAG: uroporphyrinogen-III synthase [Sulfurimicrobium sp.]|nr:uroporphyrinogen-III synthase [Sulfurimicrobium sp.]MDO9189571.1 uroporphyrinogen-III synthase [Sulfurimicrobium sp.]MDP1705945.1 uroporphyrinogen-III synthase [Sulfurimicrobium sp.]MDP2197188.1 uroporphyrinogen-III synthase [Sulfurimicrobium sp.]MDP3689093.1 uroporphyrinogen-III synthase [Sulfurimicrobium sp.]
MVDASPLEGMGVVVTRPIHQAQNLAQLIAGAGGEAILFPVLEIQDAGDLRPLNALIARLDEFDVAIFISPNAVSKALNLIRAQRQLPPQLMIAAIGKGSKKELQHCGITQIVAPEKQFDSEGLLALPQFQDMHGKKVVIFRGEGGREVLGDALISRGATLEYAECYRRCKPSIDTAPLLHRWARGEIHAITATSGESLHNLFDLLGKLGQQWLKKTPLFVPHQRIAQIAHEMGLTQVIVTLPGDEGLVAGLSEWKLRNS